MALDTGDLTDKTYRAIMIEAEKFSHDLTLQFGLLSDKCKDEKDFITKSEILTKLLLKYDDADLEDMFFGSPPATESFHEALYKILKNIEGLK